MKYIVKGSYHERLRFEKAGASEKFVLDIEVISFQDVQEDDEISQLGACCSLLCSSNSIPPSYRFFIFSLFISLQLLHHWTQVDVPPPFILSNVHEDEDEPSRSPLPR